MLYARQLQLNFIGRLSWCISSKCGENSLFKCVSQPKIMKNLLKPFGFQGRSQSSMLVLPESSSAVLVMVSSKSVSIGNCSHARLVNSSRNRAFWRGNPNLMPSYGALIEPKGSKLTLLKSTFNAKNFMCRLSWSICSNIGTIQCWNVCRSLKSQKNSLKHLIFGVQGRSRPSMLVAVLVMISSKSVSICNCSQARRVNIGKITIS